MHSVELELASLCSVLFEDSKSAASVMMPDGVDLPLLFVPWLLSDGREPSMFNDNNFNDPT